MTAFKMGKTIAEKILGAHSGIDVSAGRIAVCRVDFLMGQDGTSPLAIKAFEEMRGKKVFSPGRIAMVIDHNSPSPSIDVSRLHIMMREFALRHKIKLYDVGCGVCHQVMAEDNVLPGMLVIGADSHTTTYGALNAFSTGVGSTDLAAAMISGRIWLKIPETIKIVMNGRLKKGVFGKDLILYLIGKIGADGANYRAVEFAGSAISSLSVDSRLTVSNMAVEMGAKAGLMEADGKTAAWLNKNRVNVSHPKSVGGQATCQRVNGSRRLQPAQNAGQAFPPRWTSGRDLALPLCRAGRLAGVKADADARYEKILTFDAGKIGPMIAKPHTVDNVVPLGSVEGTKIDQVVIGTCTNGRFEELKIAAAILRNRKIHPKLKLIIVPASRGIFLRALKEGIIEAFVKSGGAVLNPGCGPCVGTHQGIPADGEVVLSTANRNFKGRMANPRAFIYLSSPATAAASAVTGRITDPRSFL